MIFFISFFFFGLSEDYVSLITDMLKNSHISVYTYLFWQGICGRIKFGERLGIEVVTWFSLGV